MNLHDFLKEVYIKIEESEDKELLRMMQQAEKDGEFSSNELLSFIDVRLNANNSK